MFLIDYIFLSVGILFLLFRLFLYFFSNKFFDTLSDHGFDTIFFAFGVVFLLLPGFLGLLYNRCDSCQKFVSSDYCTACGSYVAADSFCSCGAELDDRYSFCPSCGCDLEVSYE